MAKAKKLKQTEGGDTLREGYTSKTISGPSNRLRRTADLNLSITPKKKKKKVRSFKPKKPVKGILESQGY